MNNQNTQPNAGNAKNVNTQPGMKSDSSLQDTIMKQIHELGDSLERAGEKVEKSGWSTIGQAISSLGDKLEHLNQGGVKGAKDTMGKTDSKVDASAKTNGNRSAY
ncbi:MAG: hypothetical protein H7301_10780 [Cryobacterium sp.]|nr:hypothetical protein [Oligoflexia bacterium]